MSHHFCCILIVALAKSVLTCVKTSSYTTSLVPISLTNSSSGRSSSITNSLIIATSTTRTCGYNTYMNPSSISGRVLGGYNAAPNEFPWMVYLSIYARSTGERKTCGGSIISNSWVLTSAQCCTKTVFAQDILASFGSSELNSMSLTVAPIKMIVHPQFHSGGLFNNDFCLLQLPSPLDFSGEKIQPICLPQTCDQTCQDSDTAIIAGWGVTSYGSSQMSPILNKAFVPIVSKSNCIKGYDNSITLTDSMVCAGYLGESGVDTCTGDGGGPLHCNKYSYYQIDGIASFGKGCGLAGFPGVYSRVCTIKSWLDSYTANDTSPASTSSTSSTSAYSGTSFTTITTATITSTTTKSVTTTLPTTTISSRACGTGTFNEFPWHVFLQIYIRSRQKYTYCSGLLLKNSWILAPAHCCQRAIQATDISAYFQGDSLSSMFTFSAPVINVIMHPKFSASALRSYFNYAYDFSLLKVDIPITYQTFWNIKPICLPETCDLMCQPGENAVLVGWNHAQTGVSPSAVLQKTSVQIYVNSRCQNVGENKTCLAPSSEACGGDDAKMLVCNKRGFYTADGLSSISNCVSPTEPLTYNQVCNVYAWINQIITQM